MSQNNITISIKGSRELSRKMTKMGVSFFDFTAEMRESTKMMAEYFAGPAFASHGGVYGARWSRLNSRYELGKAKKYPGRGTLERTGTLRHSFVSQFSRTGGSVKNTAKTRDGKSLMNIHSNPNTPRHKIPLRLVMRMNKPLAREVSSIVEAGVRRKIVSL